MSIEGNFSVGSTYRDCLINARFLNSTTQLSSIVSGITAFKEDDENYRFRVNFYRRPISFMSAFHRIKTTSSNYDIYYPFNASLETNDALVIDLLQYPGTSTSPWINTNNLDTNLNGICNHRIDNSTFVNLATMQYANNYNVVGVSSTNSMYYRTGRGNSEYPSWMYNDPEINYNPCQIAIPVEGFNVGRKLHVQVYACLTNLRQPNNYRTWTTSFDNVQVNATICEAIDAYNIIDCATDVQGGHTAYSHIIDGSNGTIVNKNDYVTIPVYEDDTVLLKFESIDPVPSDLHDYMPLEDVPDNYLTTIYGPAPSYTPKVVKLKDMMKEKYALNPSEFYDPTYSGYLVSYGEATYTIQELDYPYILLGIGLTGIDSTLYSSDRIIGLTKLLVVID